MKKLTKNILSVITLDFPSLTEDAEGKLHGGFADFRDPLKGPGNGVNAPCRNPACINNKCINSGCLNTACTDISCYPTTTTTTTTKSPNSIGNTGVLI